MAFGRAKKTLKRNTAILLAASVMATSVPQYSVSAKETDIENNGDESYEVGNTVENQQENTESEVTSENSEVVAEKESSENEISESASEEIISEVETDTESTTEESTISDKTETEEMTTETETEEITTEAETEEITTETETEEVETEEVTFNAEEKNMAMRYDIKAASEWTDFVQVDVTADFSKVSELKADYQISYDIYLLKTAEFTGDLYVKPVTKLGAGWTWTEGPSESAVNVNRNSFKDCDESTDLVKYTYTGKIGSGAEEFNDISAIVVAIGSGSIDYNGVMFIDNVKLLDTEGNILAEQSFNNDYEGAVELGDIPVLEGNKEETDNVVYENNFDTTESLEGFTLGEIVTGNKSLKFTTDLSEKTGWTDIFKAELNLATSYTEKITDKLVMEYDVYFPESSIKDDFGTMKAQAAIKAGDDWTWVSQKSWPAFTIENFETDESIPGYKKLHVSIDMNDFEAYTSDGTKAWTINDITSVNVVIPCLAGDGSKYVGDLYLDNVKVTAHNKTESTDIPVVENDVVLSLDKSAWSAEAGDYQYNGAKAVDNKNVADKSVLAFSVDYTADTSYNWSEAKFDYTHANKVESMNGYNTLKTDVYYNANGKSAGNFKIKVFCESLGIDASADLAEGTAVEGMDGWYKSQFSVSFTSTDAAFEKLTLGVVGVNTDYKGDIYFDNMRFTQVTADDIYVDSTVEVKKGNGIIVAEDGRSIKTASGNSVSIASEVALVDANAIEQTKNLYAYLKAVGESDSVIFGHQNDTHHKAGASNLSNSDTKDITGSIAGVLGIDTLSLTGNEASEWDVPEAERIQNAANITKAAAAEGAIITMSSHMPNFAVIDERVKAYKAGGETATESDKVGYWKDAQGNITSYNFSGYTPGTLTGDIVTRIMPGQDLNYLFTEYLDMIADYAKELEKDGITLLFRPFHENTGSWFWWGAALCDEQAYINLYRYTVDYLKETRNVHNILYVYGPGSEAANVNEYAARYPGDDYVDMIGYDLYHQNPSKESEAGYLENVKAQNAILKEFATEHNKLYAVTETGVANGNLALLPSENEVKDWYMQLLNALDGSGVSYFLVWANWGSDQSFYTPFVTKKNADGSLHGHEMLDDFINFYNDNRSVFATDMNNGYNKIKGVTNTTTVENAAGYITSPASGSRVLTETPLIAKVTGVDNSKAEVNFRVTTEIDEIIIKAVYNEESKCFEAVLKSNELISLGEEIGIIALEVNGEEVAQISAKFNMPEKEQNSLIPEDFENYNGSSELLTGVWATNKDTGSEIGFNLTNEAGYVFGGEYGLKIDFTLKSATAWAGATKNMNSADWSAGNAMEFYTIPEKNGQKVVVQVTSASNVFEVYMQEYEGYTESGVNNIPVKVTIPFSAFVGRDNKNAVFDSKAIDSIGLWCNSVAKDDVTFPLNTTIVYDEIKVVTTDKTAITVEPMREIPKEGIWVEKIADVEYTGKAVKPVVNVYDGDKLLKLNKDYTVKYKNNVNAGKAEVTVAGKGNYSNDKIPQTFNIVPKKLDAAMINAPEYMPLKNNEQNVKVTVKDGKRTLKKGKDYTLAITFNGQEVSKVKEQGDYTITVTPGTNNNYSGMAQVKLSVGTKQMLNKANIVLPTSSIPYNTNGSVFESNAITVKLNGNIVPATDYTVSYENNDKVGTAYVVVKATAESKDYTGSVKKKFTIKGEPFKANTVVIEGFESSRDYTGKAQYQYMTLRDRNSNEELLKNVDYTILYKNNTNAGKATVTITGKGKYTGKITKNFTIKKVKLTADMISKETISVEQNKAGAKPDVKIAYNGKMLVNGKDYTLSYSNNKKVTTDAKITVTGKGNYQGKLKNAVAFNIVAKSINNSDINVDVPDMKYKVNQAEYKPTPVVKDNGVKLKKGIDYTVTYEANTKEAVGNAASTGYTATVVITAVEGGSYYTGITEKDIRKETFRITERMIKDTKVTLKREQIFDKNGVRPGKEDLEVTYNDEPVAAESYDIISYAKNDKKGTAILVLQGNGQYGGTKTVKFKIGAKTFAEKAAEVLNSFIEAFGF